MGRIPYSSGIEASAAGSLANSASSRVTIRSKGCRSRSCRLPVMRITTNTNKYKMMERINRLIMALVCPARKSPIPQETPCNIQKPPAPHALLAAASPPRSPSDKPGDRGGAASIPFPTATRAKRCLSKKGKKACVSPNDMRLPPCPRAYNRRPSPIDDMGWDMYGNHAFALWQPPGIKEQHRDKQGQGPLLRLDDIPRNQPITQAKRGRKPQLCPA